MRASVGSLVVIAACSGSETDVALPPFAAQLGGDVAAVVWSEEGALASEWIAQLDRAAIGAELDVVMRDGGVWAARVDGARSGWAKLADSTLFRAAIASGTRAPVRVFVDLQQAVDAVLRRVPQVQQLTDVVALDGLEYAIASAAIDGEEITIDAHVAGTGSVVDVLSEGTSQSLLATASDDELVIDAAFSPVQVAAALRRSVGSSGPFDGMMAGMARTMVGTAARLAEEVWDGTLAVRVGPSGSHLAVGIVDSERAAELIGGVLKRDESGVFRVRGDVSLTLAEDRLDVVGGGETTHGAGGAWAGSGIAARLSIGSVPWSVTVLPESGGLRVRITRR